MTIGGFHMTGKTATREEANRQERSTHDAPLGVASGLTPALGCARDSQEDSYGVVPSRKERW
jgi:hypothetical protein